LPGVDCSIVFAVVLEFQVVIEAVSVIGVVWIGGGLYSGWSTGLICLLGRCTGVI
jgi:hypothetical protein